MTHLNGYSLKRWNKGDGLGASDLNSNFAVVAEMAERAMLEAQLPDQAVVALEMSIRSLRERIANLEALTSMHARQRNEKEWAPLSHLGAVLQRVNDLQRHFEDTTKRLEEIYASVVHIQHDDLNRRLLRLEQQPNACAQEDFVVLVQDHERIAVKEHMLLAQTIALRAEVSMLREMAMGHARQRNEIEYTPLATTAHLLERIMKLENNQT